MLPASTDTCTDVHKHINQLIKKEKRLARCSGVPLMNLGAHQGSHVAEGGLMTNMCCVVCGPLLSPCMSDTHPIPSSTQKTPSPQDKAPCIHHPPTAAPWRSLDPWLGEARTARWGASALGEPPGSTCQKWGWRQTESSFLFPTMGRKQSDSNTEGATSYRWPWDAEDHEELPASCHLSGK